MKSIKFTSLFEVDNAKLIKLMNCPKIGAHLPLLTGEFTDSDCEKFFHSKQLIWNEYGYGPFAININNNFAGWGGFQPEGNDVDFALILHPDFWGWGLKIFKKFQTIAFEEMGLIAITALLPSNRLNSKAISRLGFEYVREVRIDGKKFMKFRLTKYHPDSCEAISIKL